ncbi:tetratricopeptide repeat protein [Vibrio splendidus]|uniref:tetratricopeptide repeat protein n=1 Tax=Vibrio splendidus TaxID=29497 RepID=UPI001FB4D0BD|nr:tetratricopeptide repeat protein [Vibrio splendidus]UOE89347.1 tetratricopeptide repeat protein [Vibrio splendidus]
MKIEYKSVFELEKNLNSCVSKGRLRKGKKLIKKFDEMLDSTEFSHDVLIDFLKVSSRYFFEFNKNTSYVSILLKLIRVYLDVGAFQSAYRAIDEAIELSKKRKNNDMVMSKLYDIYFAALLEERDIEKALSIAIDISNSNSWGLIKKGTINNIGVAFIKAGCYLEAIELLESLAESALDFDPIYLSCKLNLAICYREIGNTLESMNILEELDFYYMPSREAQVEFELVYAKSLISAGYYDEAIDRVIESIKYINEFLIDMNKIHYRRGIRESYVHRIEFLLMSIPIENFDDRILSIIIFTRQNQCSDWMTLLDWCDEFYSCSKVESIDKSELKIAIKAVASSGVPYKYGMHEKYDDHHDKFYNRAWTELSNLISKARCKYGKSNPFDLNENDILSVFKNKSVLVSFLEVSDRLVLFNNGKIVEACLERDELTSFYAEFHKYKIQDIDNKEFSIALNKVIAHFKDKVTGIVDSLLAENSQDMIYLVDKFESLPITSVFFENDYLLEKLANGSFTYSLNPIVFLNKNKREFPHDNIFGVTDTSLESSVKEVYSFANNLNCSSVNIFSENLDEESLIDKVKQADILHVTSHGEPIDYYADPRYATLVKGHLINTGMIQSEFYNFKYNLCLLHSCHSSSNLVRKQISLSDDSLNGLKSYDTFSFPRLVLINRKSTCISSNWKAFDAYSYVLSLNISKYISQGKSYKTSLTQSIAQMILTAEEDFMGKLIPLEDEHIKYVTSMSMLKSMFRHPYSYATYNCVTTL